MAQPEAKCGACHRTTVTHAPGCSHVECPHRKDQAWCGTEGLQGFPGMLAEDRVIARRMGERQRAVSVDIEEL